jgi:hypothetical protein
MGSHGCKAWCVWSFVVFVLTLADGLWYVYLYILSYVDALYIGPNWLGFHLETEMESNLRNMFKKDKTVDNVLKLNNSINIPSSQTLRS